MTVRYSLSVEVGSGCWPFRIELSRGGMPVFGLDCEEAGAGKCAVEHYIAYLHQDGSPYEVSYVG